EYERDSKLVPVDRRAPEAILEDYGEAITLTRKTLEAGLSPHQREIKRGLAGLLQNQGAILNLRLEGKPAGRTDAAELEDLYRRALAAAAESQQLSEQLGDSYRVSQA